MSSPDDQCKLYSFTSPTCYRIASHLPALPPPLTPAPLSSRGFQSLLLCSGLFRTTALTCGEDQAKTAPYCTWQSVLILVKLSRPHPASREKPHRTTFYKHAPHHLSPWQGAGDLGGAFLDTMDAFFRNTSSSCCDVGATWSPTRCPQS